MNKIVARKMAAEDGRSSRGRMDRSLDEIAAEMHSQQQQMFGRGYEGREFERVPHRERDSKRYEPYSTRRDYGHSDRGHGERGGSSWRDRDRDEEESQGTRIFVANLNYTVSWQKLKDHMKRGKYYILIATPTFAGRKIPEFQFR